jgi:hypothetical protein
MHWIKNMAAKRWNFIHGAKDHLWGGRYFARAINDPQEYEFVMNYIDQNAVSAGLAATPEEWRSSAAFYKSRNISGLVDLTPHAATPDVKYLPSIPYAVSRLLPPAQLEHTLHYMGIYAVELDRIFRLLPKIPKISDTGLLNKTPAYLHYFTGTADYYIYEYDGEDTMYGKACFSVYRPAYEQCQKFSLSNLKSNQFIELEWPR